MSARRRNGAVAPRRRAAMGAAAVIWVVLLTAPLWLRAVGGYTALASHVLVFGLVAMALNFLLGFTGVMSFGHAAYFGLGAYGTGLTLRYLSDSTWFAMLNGILLGGIAGTLLGTLICRRRGVYFAMVTIAFGQIFYYIAYRWDGFTGGYDGLRGFTRQPLHVGPWIIDIQNNGTLFYYFVLVVFAVCVALMAFLLRSPFGRTLDRDPREPAPRAGSSASRWTSISGCPSRSPAFSLDRRRAVCAAQQFRRSDRAQLHRVGRDRDHGGDGRHAQFLGTAGRCGDLRGAAGLHLVHDGELDELHRPAVRHGGDVLPERHTGHAAAEGLDVSMLEARHATKAFGSLVAVNDISLSVAPGELRAIIGPNGAGKTTFFNLMTGFFPPTSGAIFLEGREHHPPAATQRVKRGMARTFQITEIFPELTVHENVRIGVEAAAGYSLHMWTSRADAGVVRAGIDEILTLTNLTAKADRLVGELSHGDQRAAEIAMALALKPRVLLLDEPTAGMGEQETYQVAGLIRRLHKNSSYTIVLIEHDMRVVFNLADRITVLTEGTMLADGTPQEIAANPAVQAAYLGTARMNALEAEGLNTYYGKSHILHDVGLWCRRARSRRCWAGTVPASPRR